MLQRLPPRDSVSPDLRERLGQAVQAFHTARGYDQGNAACESLALLAYKAGRGGMDMLEFNAALNQLPNSQARDEFMDQWQIGHEDRRKAGQPFDLFSFLKRGR